ncbi:hypothetical protein ACIGCM_16875 [Pseudomonas sp. NPDC078700]|uniref:hypothetical protein n=1 Tax=Pseudomonas sp. NPDC078700 TaxID=3364424 RepID=UPI0037CC511C
MTKTTTVSVEEQVRMLAQVHQVTAERDGMSRMASNITRLAGDDVELDYIEQLLINLNRKGVLTKRETLSLQGRYLIEKRSLNKKLSA